MSLRWSLRRRLVSSVLGVVAVALGLLAVLLHVSLRRTLYQRFDEELGAEARGVAARVEEGPGGRWEIEDETDGRGVPEGLWYRVRADDGTELDGSDDVPGPAETASLREGTAATLTLEDGLATRTLRLDVAPRLDEAVSRPSGRRLVVLVARSTAELEATLSVLAVELAAATGLVAVATALLVSGVVRRSIRPVASLGRQLDAIDAAALDRRLSTAELPTELAPAARRVNELLARLEASFDRERRFTELALARERETAAYRDALCQVRSIAAEMQAMVESLLALARAEVGALATVDEPVDLKELVDGSAGLLNELAGRRGLRFTNHIAPGTRVRSDPWALRLVTQNLLANAMAYTESGGWVTARSSPDSGLWLVVADSGPQLEAVDLERVFQRFVRLDPARRTGAHHGIGLALVRTLCTHLGLSISAENHDDGSLAFVVRVSGHYSPA